jgi:hypothetical protein
MKKCIVIMFVLFVHGGCLFTAYALSSNTHHESTLLLNFNYSLLMKSPFDPGANADTQFDSFGTGLTFRSYANWSNFGFYLNTYFLFPGRIVSTKTGGSITSQEQINMMLGLIAGPSFRFMLEGGLNLYFALGFHFSYITGTYTHRFPDTTISGDFQSDLNGTLLGAGGEFGLKYDTSEVLHVSFGVVWTLDFTSNIYVKEPLKDRVAPKYAWLSIRPFIGIGISITSDHSWYINLINEEY